MLLINVITLQRKKFEKIILVFLKIPIKLRKEVGEYEHII